MKQASVRERIEKIMAKHTKALTQFHEGEFRITDADTVVLNQYEATNDLLSLFTELLAEIVPEEKEEIIGCPERLGWNECRRQFKANTKKVIGGEE